MKKEGTKKYSIPKPEANFILSASTKSEVNDIATPMETESASDAPPTATGVTTLLATAMNLAGDNETVRGLFANTIKADN